MIFEGFWFFMSESLSLFDLALSYLNQGLSYVVPAIILLGLLVFIHELGHFLAAKHYGVGVETFSLGFGPKILKIVHSETVYCISAFPLGGYVKMYGDEPGREIPPEKKEKSFLHKPVSQRIVIALAGPLMNLFLACFIFYIIAQWIGDKALSPFVGEISNRSSAYEKGFRAYDKILSVNNHQIKTWDQVKDVIENSPGEKLDFQIQREGEKISLSVIPKVSTNDNLFSTSDRIGKILGLHSNLHLPIAGVPPDSPLYSAGVRTGDHIMEIEGKSILWFKDIEPMILKKLSIKESIVLKVRRFEDFRSKDHYKDMDIELLSKNLKNRGLKLFIPETLVAEVRKDSPAEQAGLKKMDKISEINSHPIETFQDIVKWVSSYKEGDPPLEIVVQRGGEEKSFTMIPKLTHLEDSFGKSEDRFVIGITPLLFEKPETFIWKSSDFGSAVKRALHQTWRWNKVTVLSLVRILQNRMSSKNIGGFISMGHIAQQSWSFGLGAFLTIMAVLSINLFIINLLPIPILDGGQLLLFTLEAIKGAPLSLKKMEIAQQIGFLIILFLMGFALFNDFNRLFGS